MLKREFLMVSLTSNAWPPSLQKDAGGLCRFTFLAGEYPNGETLIASKRDFTACKNDGRKDIFLLMLTSNFLFLIKINISSYRIYSFTFFLFAAK